MEGVGFKSLTVVWFFLLTLIILPMGGAQTVQQREVEALNDFMKNVHDDPKKVLETWDPTLPSPCSWFHITCDSSSRVTRIDLGNAKLSGTISPSLGNLANLQFLELYGNQLSGSMPKELGKLANLVSLDLYSNVLTGPIPYEYGNLRSLRFLRLENNNLCGRIPIESLSHCRKVEVVHFYPNKRLCNPVKVLPENCPHTVHKLYRYYNEQVLTKIAINCHSTFIYNTFQLLMLIRYVLP